MKKLLALSATLLLVACGQGNQAQQPAAPATETPAPAAQQAAPVAPSSEITVNYACTGEGKKMGVTAVYTAQGDYLVSAKLSADGKEYPELKRKVENKDDNEFTDGTYTWITDVADARNVAIQAGNMLTEKGTSTVNGETLPTDNIIFKYCEVSVGLSQ